MTDARAGDAPTERPLPLTLALLATALSHTAGLAVLLVEREALRERHPDLTDERWLALLAGHAAALLGALGVWRWSRWGLPLLVLAALALFGLDELAGLPELHQALVVLLLVGVLWASKPVLRRLL